MKTYPLPGQTKFTSRLPDDEARNIAASHYYVEHTVRCSDSSGEYHAVMAYGNWVALIGITNGKPSILHKRPDGTRELETLGTADVL